MNDKGWKCSTCSRYEKYKVLAGKPEGNTWLGKPIQRWESNIVVGLRGKGWKDVD